MSKRLIKDPAKFPVQPYDIAVGRFWDAFGNMETEEAAARVVLYCHERGKGWEPFTREEIGQHFSQGHFNFQYLTSQGWLQEIKGVVHFTFEFVLACFAASPAGKHAA